MRFSPQLEKWRIINTPYASKKGDDFGAFIIPYQNYQLKVIASSADEEFPWEHVSVSLKNRCPNWIEMCYIKDLFWDEEEIVMQLHPPRSKWINNHEYCLHLWKPTKQEIPTPPEILVGIKI